MISDIGYWLHCEILEMQIFVTRDRFYTLVLLSIVDITLVPSNCFLTLTFNPNRRIENVRQELPDTQHREL